MTAEGHEDVIKSTSRLLMQHCRDAYEHEASDWRDLDRKAQGAVAICGIFLTAAAFAVRHLDNWTWIGQVTLLALVFCVLRAASWSFRSLKVAHLKDGVEPVSEVYADAEELMGSSAADTARLQERVREFVLARADRWRRAQESLEDRSKDKAEWISRAQWWLTWALPILLLLVSDAVIKKFMCGIGWLMVALYAAPVYAVYWYWAEQAEWDATEETRSTSRTDPPSDASPVRTRRRQS